VSLLERFNGFFFCDSEEPVLKWHIDELQAGHCSFAVAMAADRVNEVAESLRVIRLGFWFILSLPLSRG
jgi:hypothetical protein